MSRIIAFEELRDSNLIVDAQYKSGTTGNFSDEVISKLLGVGNQSGIRRLGSLSPFNVSLVSLYTTLDDVNWPDGLNVNTGIFTYYGDNKSPGRELHDTKQKGNQLFRLMFDYLHLDNRGIIPPIFIFTKAGIAKDVIFRGLAVPGAQRVEQSDDLVAIWKTKGKQRFQNYRAIFTILDEPIISRKWIHDLQSGLILSENCPKSFKDWVQKGIYRPLVSENVRETRDKSEQIPCSTNELSIIRHIVETFSNRPHDFEACAAELVKIMDKNIVDCELTRPTVDGGRDAIGIYRIGPKESGIRIEFALEAKCYSINNSVGVKETSRLISRIRHRQFGIIVTTSFIARQAYKEIIEDIHPIIIICANDIIDILRTVNINSIGDLDKWLKKNNYFIR